MDSVDPVVSARTADRRAALIVSLFVLGVYLLTMGGHTYSVDGETYLAATRSLLHRSTVLQLNPDNDGLMSAVLNKNGDLVSTAPIGTLLLFAPFAALGKLASYPFADAWKDEVARLVYLSANSVFTALTGGLTVLGCIALGARRRTAVLVALTYCLGTWAWGHSSTDFSEPGTALVLTAAILASLRWWRVRTARAAFVVGLLAACVSLTRVSTALFVPVFFVVGVWGAGRDRRDWLRQALAFVGGGAIPGLVTVWYTWLKFGKPFATGYAPLPYTTPIYEGLFGQFASPGKGIFWYAPITIVALFATRQAYLRAPRYVVLVGGVLVVHLYVYARFAIWSGDLAYGPRYMAPVLPAIVLVTAPVLDTAAHWVRAARVAAVAGFLVPGLMGALFYANAVYGFQREVVVKNLQIAEPSNDQFFLAWDFQPRSSPLMQSLRSVDDVVDNVMDRLSGEPGGITPLPGPTDERIYWYARGLEPDVWWAWWSAKGGPHGAYLLLIAPLLAIGASIWFWRRWGGRFRHLAPARPTFRRPRPFVAP